MHRSKSFYRFQFYNKTSINQKIKTAFAYRLSFISHIYWLLSFEGYGSQIKLHSQCFFINTFQIARS